MSRGMLVITTDRTAGPDLIEHGRNGWLIEAASTASLKKAIEHFIRQPAQIAELGKAGQESARQRPWTVYGNELAAAIVKTILSNMMTPMATSLATHSDGINLFLQRKLQKEIAEKKLLKAGIWAYFLLLIFEGALRKWVLPSLATPLLIVRDPIALVLILVTLSRTRVLNNLYVYGILLISGISFFTAITLGHGNIFVALYGVRIFVLHFPLIFIIGHVFTKEDVIALGKVTLWISLFMAILIGLQFYSPQSAWVNKGVGNEASAGFSGALGYFRPPGTFSFTNGNSLFFGFDGCFVIYFLIGKDNINRLLLVLASIALLASIPLSISRTLFFSLAVTLVFALFGALTQPRFLSKILYAFIGLSVLVVALSQTHFFQTASEAFTARFQDASEIEGGVQGVLADRYLGGLVGAITNSSQIPFFGYGIGMGTNAGSTLLVGERTFLIAEGEWGRLIGEMGLLLGLLIILIRLSFSLDLLVRSFQQLKRGNLLPWILLSFLLTNIPQSQWAQPTSLGFSIVIGGIVLAALKPQLKNV